MYKNGYTQSSVGVKQYDRQSMEQNGFEYCYGHDIYYSSVSDEDDYHQHREMPFKGKKYAMSKTLSAKKCYGDSVDEYDNYRMSYAYRQEYVNKSYEHSEYSHDNVN